jgi:FK506-binding protein 2
MKFTTLTGALALYASAASALNKPLDIQVDKAVECTRKTVSGELCRRIGKNKRY